MACRSSLSSLRRFCGMQISAVTVFSSFTKKLPDYFFHGHFLNVNVTYVASLEQLTAGFGDFRARNFQLHRHRRLFRYFAECRKIARRLSFESQAQNFVSRKPIDNFFQWPVEKYPTVVDHEHTMTQLLDVLHVMAGQQRDNVM